MPITSISIFITFSILICGLVLILGGVGSALGKKLV